MNQKAIYLLIIGQLGCNVDKSIAIINSSPEAYISSKVTSPLGFARLVSIIPSDDDSQYKEISSGASKSSLTMAEKEMNSDSL